MLRRSPTRIELKIDDVNEWIAMRKEKEKKNSESVAGLGTMAQELQVKSKRELIHERIGYESTRTTSQANNRES